jgi:hypothetical protein
MIPPQTLATFAHTVMNASAGRFNRRGDPWVALAGKEYQYADSLPS